MIAAYQTQSTQNYSYRSRIHELRNTSSEFVNMVTVENDKITDPTLKHRISVVTFPGNSEIKKDFTVPVSDGGVKDIGEYAKNTSMESMGKTTTHLAMENAAKLNTSSTASARPESKKVVILFTDGKPFYKKGMQDSFVHQAQKAVEHS